MDPDTNIVLIGMPGVGKSTVGVLLAKATERAFVDTDVVIQARQGRSLQHILDAEGTEGFCRIEQQHVLDLRCRRHVIATGGSVVYSPPAMAHLKAGGVIVHLHLPLEPLRRRVADPHARGVVMPAGKTLDDLYAERRGLYRRYADVTMDCTGRNHDQVVADILVALGT